MSQFLASLPFKISDQIRVPIKAALLSPTDDEIQVEFAIQHKRLSEADIYSRQGALVKEHTQEAVAKALVDRLIEGTTNWDLKASDHTSIAYSSEHFRELLQAIPGLPAIVWRRVRDCSLATEKN